MRVYIALANIPYVNDLIYGADILCAYPYFQKNQHLIDNLDKVRNILCDSGVFTMINSGKRFEIKSYIDEYADFVRSHNIKQYVEMDVDQIYGVKETRRMRDYLENRVGWQSIPEGHYAAENMKSTVVPFRNGIMLAIASGIAESRGLDTVMIANHAGDHAIYPDCRGEFIEAMSLAMQNGSYNGVHILAPYTFLTKGQIAARGKEIGLDYSETWSCYKGGEHHCGKCGTCVERKEALEYAGINDTTIYEN